MQILWEDKCIDILIEYLVQNGHNQAQNTAKSKYRKSKMNSFQSNVNVFNTDLLLSTITNTDSLVRNYKNVCTDNNQLKKNLQSITDSSVRLTNMYQQEVEKTKRLTDEKQHLDARIKEIEQQIAQITNKNLNQDTIHKQTIAELEEQIDKLANTQNADYIDLCKQFVVQGNILQQNNLATAAHRRKHKNVIDILKRRGEKYEELLLTTIKRPANVDAKTMVNRSIATMTETIGPPICQPEKNTVKTCDKGTMHRASTATRSTCTSVFIKKIDASTSTDPIDQSNKHVRNIFKETLSHPALLSPIKNIDSMQASKTAAATLHRKSTCNQGTITHLANVGKEIGYTRNVYSPQSDRNSVDSGFASPIITKNEFSDLFTNQNLFSPAAMSTNIINPELLRVWQILGETIFSIVGSGRIFNDHALNFVNNAPFSRACSTSRSIDEPISKLQEELLKFKSINQLETEELNNSCLEETDEIQYNRSAQNLNLIQLKSQARNEPERKSTGNNLDGTQSLRENRGLTENGNIGEKLNVRKDGEPSKESSDHKHRSTSKTKATKRATTYDELFGSSKRIKLPQKVNLDKQFLISNTQ